MQATRRFPAIALAMVMALAACGNRDTVPSLMNVRSTTGGPDEFGIIPPKPLEMPEDLAALPDPTPGGANRTDRNPNAEAVAALGGNPSVTQGVNSAHAGLYAYAARYGVTQGIRETLAAEDLEYRRENDGRLLERLFNVNVYYRAYQPQSLDQHAELWRWRQAGVRTPSAPPPQDGEGE
ncbi:DUF3035 domain-containing protein [Fuscovulum ytuae]|uniref:DUF3035 domain-containing protein n=1 Tax=Fuscovulum ytuae TaxID=3042299 RepID=A0ABY8Q3B0_9RHOB|nr:DUF3035 domain-containing protein [Fuscovulum sp. YMD61]WGV15339.1 DUF3035 domain-containing protein [Fuscovulum sp. YMD61]